MKEYIGKDGIPVREYELEDVHLLLESPQWYLDGGMEKSHDTGERTRRVIPAKVREALLSEKKANYFAEVNRNLDYFIKDFKKRFQDSPDKDATIALEKKRWEAVFDLETDLPMHLQDFNPQQIRKAWRQIIKEGESNCMDGTSLRHLRFHTNARARFKFLQWLRDTPKEQILWDSTVRADFAIMWAENVRDIVRHFSTPESAEVQVFKRPNSQALELIEQDLAETRATRDTEPPATPWRTMELIEHSSRGEATSAELAALMKAKLEASKDYHTPRRIAAALLTELEGLLTKHGNLLQNLGAQPMPIAIASDWKDYLTTIAQTPAPDMIAGQAFAFTADGKLIEKPTLQTIVEYFNEQGAEVQLCANVSNEEVVLSGQVLKDNTDLEADAREADPSELQALFDAKFTKARDSNRFKTPQAFAKAEAKRLRKAWADDADRFPLAEQWFEHLERIASETATGDPAQPERANTPPQGSEGGTGAEIGAKLTQRQAAYLLAYQNAGIQDPRSDPNRLADKRAKQLCRKCSPTTGGQLYERFDELRSKSDRQRAFNTALDRFSEKHNKRIVESLLTDIKTIIPLLEGEQRTEAQNDLKRWDTAFQNEMN